MFFRQPMKKDAKPRFGGKRLSTKAPPEVSTVEVTKIEVVTLEQDAKRLAEIVQTLKEKPIEVKEEKEKKEEIKEEAKKEYSVFMGIQTTCFHRTEREPSEGLEIIELSALLVDKETGEPVSSFEQFVRPTKNPKLSDWCKQVTSIDQSSIDEAQPFSVATKMFHSWLELFEGEKTIFYWGDAVMGMLCNEFDRQEVAEQDNLFLGAIDLQNRFSEENEYKNLFSLKAAMKKLRIGYEGSFNKGIDIATNLSRLAKNLIVPS